MFPNPQDVLRLPPNPDIEQYRKLAKDLVKACASEDPKQFGAWARRWIPDVRMAGDVEEFAARTLSRGGRKCVLADAQFVLARCYGFDSWTKFAAHLDALEHAKVAADFEAAADAIIAGDEATLRRLLAANPGLIRAQSTRAHHATLLHYVAANGVENWRQVTPANIVAITRILLDAGAEVDAEMLVYGGRCTTLGLTATSEHPFRAGVQNPLMKVLLDHGARIEHPNLAGNRHTAIVACLANGRPEAAEFLAAHGAVLDLAGAAGIGSLADVKRLIDAPGVTGTEIEEAFLYASGWGRPEVVAFLLDRGVNPTAHQGDGQTGFHWAAMGAKTDTIKLLLARGVPLEAKNQYGGTVLGTMLWSAAHRRDPDAFIPGVEALIQGGARLSSKYPPVSPAIDRLLAEHGSAVEPAWNWGH